MQYRGTIKSVVFILYHLKNSDSKKSISQPKCKQLVIFISFKYIEVKAYKHRYDVNHHAAVHLKRDSISKNKQEVIYKAAIVD